MFTRVSRLSRPSFRSPFAHSRRSFIPLRPPSSSHILKALSWTSLGALGIGMIGVGFLWNHRPPLAPPTITVLNDDVFNTNLLDIINALPVVPSSISEQEEYYRKCLREFVHLAKQGPDYQLQAAFAMLKVAIVAMVFFQLGRAPLKHEVIFKDSKEIVPAFKLGQSLEERAQLQNAQAIYAKIIEDLFSKEIIEDAAEKQVDKELARLEHKYNEIVPPEILAKAEEQLSVVQEILKADERQEDCTAALFGEIAKGTLLASAGPQFYNRAAIYLCHSAIFFTYKSLAAYQAHLPKEVAETVLLLFAGTGLKMIEKESESKLGESVDVKT